MNTEALVPIDEAAKHFSVSTSTIRVWMRKNRIPKHTYIKLGSTYRFKLSAMEEALLNETDDDDEQSEQIALY